MLFLSVIVRACESRWCKEMNMEKAFCCGESLYFTVVWINCLKHSHRINSIVNIDVGMSMSGQKGIVVIFKSTYGSTRQYAKWIAEELNASLFEVASIKPAQLLDYDVVIYGGGLYASGINGVKLVVKNPCKVLVVFTVGAADPKTTDYSAILAKNFTPELLSKIKVFHLHGGIDYERLGFIHKVMMSMVKMFRVEKNPELRSEEDRLFLETFGAKFDFTDKSAIKPLVNFVRTHYGYVSTL